MRYRIISSSYGNKIIEHYPMLDRYYLEGISNGTETHHYITIVNLEELYDLMYYVGAPVVIDPFVITPGWYYEPTIEIYDGPREGDV